MLGKNQYSIRCLLAACSVFAILLATIRALFVPFDPAITILDGPYETEISHPWGDHFRQFEIVLRNDSVHPVTIAKQSSPAPSLSFGVAGHLINCVPVNVAIPSNRHRLLDPGELHTISFVLDTRFPEYALSVDVGGAPGIKKTVRFKRLTTELPDASNALQSED
jgi:hypothetical protein